MQPDNFANAPANPIADYRTAESALDTESEAALRQIIGLRKNGEVGTGTAFPMAIDRVEIRFARKLARGSGKRGARRIGKPEFIRA